MVTAEAPMLKLAKIDGQVHSADGRTPYTSLPKPNKDFAMARYYRRAGGAAADTVDTFDRAGETPVRAEPRLAGRYDKRVWARVGGSSKKTFAKFVDGREEGWVECVGADSSLVRKALYDKGVMKEIAYKDMGKHLHAFNIRKDADGVTHCVLKTGGNVVYEGPLVDDEGAMQALHGTVCYDEESGAWGRVAYVSSDDAYEFAPEDAGMGARMVTKEDARVMHAAATEKACEGLRETDFESQVFRLAKKGTVGESWFKICLFTATFEGGGVMMENITLEEAMKNRAGEVRTLAPTAGSVAAGEGGAKEKTTKKKKKRPDQSESAGEGGAKEKKKKKRAEQSESAGEGGAGEKKRKKKKQRAEQSEGADLPRAEASAAGSRAGADAGPPPKKRRHRGGTSQGSAKADKKRARDAAPGGDAAPAKKRTNPAIAAEATPEEKIQELAATLPAGKSIKKTFGIACKDKGGKLRSVQQANGYKREIQRAARRDEATWVQKVEAHHGEVYLAKGKKAVAYIKVVLEATLEATGTPRADAGAAYKRIEAALAATAPRP